MTTSTAPDEIPAGEYEVASIQLDVITSEPGRPLTYKRYRRRDLVTLDAAEARRLVLAGAVVEPGALEQAAALAAKAAYDAALAALSPEARAALTGQPVGRRRRAVPSTAPTGGAATTAPPAEPDGGADDEDENADDAPGDDGEQSSSGDGPPPRIASKGVWAEYAVGADVIPADEVDALTKEQIVVRVREHEAAQQGS